MDTGYTKVAAWSEYVGVGARATYIAGKNGLLNHNISSKNSDEISSNKSVVEYTKDPIKTALKDNLREYIFQKTKRNPMILPIIMEI